MTKSTSGGCDQFETSPEAIDQELRPALCERRQTDRLKTNYRIDTVTQLRNETKDPEPTYIIAVHHNKYERNSSRMLVADLFYGSFFVTLSKTNSVERVR